MHVKHWRSVVLLCLIMGLQPCLGAPSKVFFINSYHEGYAPSDESMNAFVERAEAYGMQIEVMFMDSKRNPDAFHMLDASHRFLKRFEKLQPDVVVAADDNAVRYIVAPFLRGSTTPVVFVGVNWSCTQYGLPAANVTGILEVLPIGEALEIAESLAPRGKRLLVLSEKSNSEEKNREVLDPFFRERGLSPSYQFVRSFEEWKQAFREAQDTFDLVYLPTNGAIQGWNHEEAQEWVSNVIKIPVFTCDDFMMPYCVFGLTKIAAEQGELGFERTLLILNGERPDRIPVIGNTQSRMWINASLAEAIGDSSIVESFPTATIVE